VRDRTALRDLGVRTQLNHPPGVVCPFRQSGPVDFILYDISGIHEISVDFCGCRTEDGTPEGGVPLEHQTQLLRACWWPATVHSPKTCVTFSVLRQFQALNCLGKLSAYDFLRGLEKCTNHNGLNKPPVSIIIVVRGAPLGADGMDPGPPEAVHAYRAAVARGQANEAV
jgi:hypothetical protein